VQPNSEYGTVCTVLPRAADECLGLVSAAAAAVDDAAALEPVDVPEPLLPDDEAPTVVAVAEFPEADAVELAFVALDEAFVEELDELELLMVAKPKGGQSDISLLCMN
jgi:hypothetical protein